MPWERSRLQGRPVTGRSQARRKEHRRGALLPCGMTSPQVFLGYKMGIHGLLRWEAPRNQKSLRPQNTRKHTTQGRPSGPEHGYYIFYPESRHSNTFKDIRHGRGVTSWDKFTFFHHIYFSN